MLGTTTLIEFLRNVKLWFGSSHFDDPKSELIKLTQHGTVGDFQTEFESLMNKTKGVSQALLIFFYFGGLKSSILRELWVNCPSSLEETFALARLCEGKLLDNQREYLSSAKPITSMRVD